MPDCNTIDLKAMSNCLNLRQDLLNRIANVLSEPSYREAMENSSVYNNRLVGERQMRLPFLDAQTGVAQADCYLWMNRWERMPGKYEGQLYTYPARKWRKKRRQYLLNDEYLTRKAKESEPNETDNNSSNNNSSANNSNNNNNNNNQNIGNNSNSSVGLNDTSLKLETAENSNDKYFDPSKEGWYQDFDDGSDLPDAGELDDPESDYDDYEEYSSRKKRKKRESQKRKRVEYNDSEKPFSCDLCGARYKTRPGLSYHYSHTHQSDNENRGNRGSAGGLEDEDMPYTPPRQVIPPANQAPPSQQVQPTTSMANIPIQQVQQPHNQPNNSMNAANRSSSSSSSTSTVANAGGAAGTSAAGDDQGEVPRASSGKPPISNYCDFCLGNSVENKKTKSAEELVSCSDCGRSAHPTCLQFTPNMTNSVKKYRWQCIECKSCGLCGTSDNDDQLLFCDDCDRGYHMYCLRPPLSEPPEGSWSCHLCIEEYHTPKK